MLAEAACRRSSWLRSMATTRRLARPLQVQATARSREDDEETADKRPSVAKGRRPSTTEPQSLNFHLQMHSSGIGDLLAAAEHKNPSAKRGSDLNIAENVAMQADATAGDFSLVTNESPAEKDIDRAKGSLQKLARSLADPRAAVARESGFQRARRQLKAATGKLDRMLSAMRLRRDYAQVEAVAFLWEKEFPQFAGQRKHWCVICEHYAWALNSQQRFEDVVDKFSPCYRKQEIHTRNAEIASLLTPRLAQSIFVALGHLRDATGALQLLDTMKRRDVHVTKVSYFHALNAMLHDQTFTDFESVMQLCEEMVSNLPGEIVPLSLLPMVMMTAAACGQSKRAMKLYCHPSDMPMSTFTEFRFEICLQQLNHLGEDTMIIEIYRNLMKSTEASRDLKERVSKYLFRKRVALTTVDINRNKRLGIACEILEIMNQHKIAVSHHAIYPLMRALLLDPPYLNNVDGDQDQQDGQVQIRVERAEDLHMFFSQFPHSLEWNGFALCEAIVASVRAHRADLVDDLFVYALDSGMSIKYAALEQVVVYYYRLGLINDLARVSDIVRALRLNKHIPLGIAVTEIGMAANLRLNRYEEVVMLFEDFSSLDGERRRVLQRRFMLKTVLTAYTHLGRGDEATAIQALLHQNHSTLLDESGSIEGEKTKDDIRLDEVGQDESELVDNSNSDMVGEQERLSLHRFTLKPSASRQL